MEKKIKVIGIVDPQGYEIDNRVYDRGVLPYDKTRKCKDMCCEEMEKVYIRQATKQGYIECCVPGVADFAYPTSKLRRGRVQKGGTVCPTITTTSNICKIIRWKKT